MTALRFDWFISSNFAPISGIFIPQFIFHVKTQSKNCSHKHNLYYLYVISLYVITLYILRVILITIVIFVLIIISYYLLLTSFRERELFTDDPCPFHIEILWDPPTGKVLFDGETCNYILKMHICGAPASLFHLICNELHLSALYLISGINAGNCILLTITLMTIFHQHWALVKENKQVLSIYNLTHVFINLCVSKFKY